MAGGGLHQHPKERGHPQHDGRKGDYERRALAHFRKPTIIMTFHYVISHLQCRVGEKIGLFHVNYNGRSRKSVADWTCGSITYRCGGSGRTRRIC